MEKYRFDQYDSVYEYSKEQQAYIFIGKLNGRTESEFIEEYENRQDNPWGDENDD